VDLGPYGFATFQHHVGYTLALSPLTSTVPLSELSENSDSAPCCNGFDFGDLSDDLKTHHRIVPKDRCAVNARMSA
jgi:hypothetical protein